MLQKHHRHIFPFVIKCKSDSLLQIILNETRVAEKHLDRQIENMWQSLWKPSPSRQKIDNEVSSECKNKECNKKTSKSGHQLSQMTIKGCSSTRGRVSSLYCSRNSNSVLNGESFVASTPASSMICNNRDSDITSIASESTSYNNCPHDEFQTSTQIENIESEKLANSSNYIQNCKNKTNVTSSLSETPSRFQLPAAHKEIFPKDESSINGLREVRTSLICIGLVSICQNM